MILRYVEMYDFLLLLQTESTVSPALAGRMRVVTLALAVAATLQVLAQLLKCAKPRLPREWCLLVMRCRWLPAGRPRHH